MSKPESVESLVATTKLIDYVHDMGWSGSRMGRFVYGGPSMARVTFGYDSPPQIGVWRAVLDPAGIAHAQSVLRASNYQRIARPTSYAPESKFVAFDEEPVKGQSDGMTNFSLRAIPDAMRPVINEFDQLLALVKEHPERVVRGIARWSETRFSPERELTVDVELTNIGKESVVISNPFDDRESGTGVLRLDVTMVGRLDVREAVDLSATDVVTTRAVDKSPTITLSPGETWKARVARRFHVQPGKYQGILGYHSGLKYQDGGAEISGELPMSLGEVLVEESP